MATEARVDIASRRNEARTITIRIVGVDWSGATFRHHVRLGPDTPGTPMLNLVTVINPNAEGLRVAGVAVENGVPVTTVRLRYNLTTMRDMIPYSGEIGDDARYAYAIQVDGVTRLAGNWWAVAAVMDSDAAPENRPSGYGSGLRAPAVASAIGLTFAGEDVIEVRIDDVELLGALLNRAEDAADSAEADATLAGEARSQALVAASTVFGVQQAVLDAVAGLPVSATLPLQAVTRTAMAAFTGMTAGRQAFLGELGREGVFVWQTGNRSVDVTKDPRQAVWVPPAATPNGSAGAWRRIVTGHFNVKWFGAKGDAVFVDGARPTYTGTDDTDAIQAALDYMVVVDSGTIFFPRGVYVVSKAPTRKNRSFAQLLLPTITGQTDAITIRLLGETPAGGWNAPGAPIIFSSYDVVDTSSVLGDAAMIGGSNSEDTTVLGRNWLNFYAENMIFCALDNPAMHGLDLRFIPYISIEHCRVTTTGVSEPTKGEKIGLRGSLNYVPTQNIINDLVISGYYYGLETGELFNGNALNIGFCKWALAIPRLEHGNSFGFMIFTNCQNGIRVFGPADVRIQMISIEHSPANLSPPAAAWIEPYGYDIYDPNNYLRGKIGIHMHDEPPLSVFKAESAEIDYNSMGAQPTMTRPFLGFYERVHKTSVDELRSFNGKEPWRTWFMNQPTVNNGFIAAEAYCNLAAGLTDPSDLRVAQVSVLTDGATTNGKFVFGTKRGPAFRDQVTIDSRGNLTLLSRDQHFNQGVANGDLAGRLPYSGTSTGCDFVAPFNVAPVVVATPTSDIGVGNRFWVDVGTTGFSIRTATPYTGAFTYAIIGNPN